MSMEITPMRPSEGWPVSFTSASGAAIVNRMASPGPNMSWFITGYILSGGGTLEGFTILRRNAVQFVEAADNFSVSDDTALEPGTGDFAIEFGIKAASTAVSVSKILYKIDSNDGYTVSIDSSGKLSVLVGDGSDTATIVSVNAINDNLWHHVIINMDTSEDDGLQMYIDGEVAHVEAGDMTAVGNVTGSSTALTIVGEASKTFSISALGLYSQILSSAEIATRYADGAGSKFSGDETGLSAAWNLDEGAGSAHADEVASNDGGSTSIVWLEGEGLPLDPHTLKNTIPYGAGVLNTDGVVPTTIAVFPHAIKIGRNNPVRLSETTGTFDVQLFGYPAHYA